MSSISKVLVQQTHLEIFNCVRMTSVDMKGWIANQKYFVDSDLTDNDYSVRVSDKEYLKTALANDCNRMSAAAIESIAGVQLDSNLNKSGAWGVIRSYYASFFAIHSIMRMFGISCSQLLQSHVDKIFEFANVVGKTGRVTRLEKGFYSIRIDKHFANVSFHKYKDSHRDTWGEFLSLIEKLIDESRNATAIYMHKDEVIDILTTVKKGITRSRCTANGNWLSTIRNSVNYQHTHGVWFPYERKSIAPTYINNFSRDWVKPISTLDLGLTGCDIQVFFNVTLLINSLFRELLVSCIDRSGSTNHIFTNGCMKLMNTIQAT